MVLSITVFINSRVLKKTAAVSTDQINGVNRAIYEKKSTRVLHNTHLTMKRKELSERCVLNFTVPLK